MILKSRLRIVIGAFILIYFAVLVRAFYYQVIGDEALEKLRKTQYEAEIVIPPTRGKILDRKGSELAVTVPAFSVGIQPVKVKDKKNVARVASEVFKVPFNEAMKKLAKKKSFVFIARKVDNESVKRFLEKLGSLDEFRREYSNFRRIGVVSVFPDPRRVYPGGKLASNVLGFCDVDLRGLEGIEKTFDEYLRGKARKVKCVRDARGRLIIPEDLSRIEDDGKTIQLTIDRNIQFICERELEKGVKEFRAKSGVAIVMSPSTGEILAMAVYPNYDPNSPGSYPPWRRRNRIITDVYEPGSTFKVFLIAGAIDSGKVRLSDKIYCEKGEVTVQGRRIHDTHENEWLTVPEILKVSSNIGAYKIAERLTPDLFYNYIRKFGFGRKTGVELLGEVSGILPSLEQFKKPIRYATASFGQGVAVTPLQVTAAFSAAVNGGILVKPSLIREIRTIDGEVLYRGRPKYEGRVISAETSRTMRRLLADVVSEHGTGSLAKIGGYSVGGKTGTSQKVDPVKGGYSDKRIASFIGFFPVDEPQFVITVIIDEPKEEIYGGLVAAPIFKRIASKVAIYAGIPPDEGSEDFQVARAVPPGFSPPGADGRPPVVKVSLSGDSDVSLIMPDLKGLTMVEAIELLDSLGVEYEMKGSGIVVSQYPRPGRKVSGKTRCVVVFGEE